MKKIHFNNHYGLTEAVLTRRKTMTRRMATALNHSVLIYLSDWGMDDRGRAMLTAEYADGHTQDIYPEYQPGEEVAVAQSYRSIEKEITEQGLPLNMKDEFLKCPGANNKLFVRADLMLHRIRITDIRVEHLQDISDEDCLKEGIYEDAEEHGGLYTTPFYDFVGNKKDGFYEPRLAFTALIDRISGRGTWKKNPWVWVYTFELMN